MPFKAAKRFYKAFMRPSISVFGGSALLLHGFAQFLHGFAWFLHGFAWFSLLSAPANIMGPIKPFKAL